MAFRLKYRHIQTFLYITYLYTYLVYLLILLPDFNSHLFLLVERHYLTISPSTIGLVALNSVPHNIVVVYERTILTLGKLVAMLHTV